MLISKLFKIKY